MIRESYEQPVHISYPPNTILPAIERPDSHFYLCRGACLPLVV